MKGLLALAALCFAVVPAQAQTAPPVQDITDSALSAITTKAEALVGSPGAKILIYVEIGDVRNGGLNVAVGILYQPPGVTAVRHFSEPGHELTDMIMNEFLHSLQRNAPWNGVVISISPGQSSAQVLREGKPWSVETFESHVDARAAVFFPGVPIEK